MLALDPRHREAPNADPNANWGWRSNRAGGDTYSGGGGYGGRGARADGRGGSSSFVTTTEPTMSAAPSTRMGDGQGMITYDPTTDSCPTAHSSAPRSHTTQHFRIVAGVPSACPNWRLLTVTQRRSRATCCRPDLG